MSALVHDLICVGLLLAGMAALCSVIRDDLNRAQRARRIFKGWQRNG